MDLHERMQAIEKELRDENGKIATIEQSSKSAHKRIDSLEQLIESIHEMVFEVKHMREELSGLSGRVSDMEKLPKKRYETAVTAFITTVVGVVAGYFLRKVGF